MVQQRKESKPTLITREKVFPQLVEAAGIALIPAQPQGKPVDRFLLADEASRAHVRGAVVDVILSTPHGPQAIHDLGSAQLAGRVKRNPTVKLEQTVPKDKVTYVIENLAETALVSDPMHPIPEGSLPDTWAKKWMVSNCAFKTLMDYSRYGCAVEVDVAAQGYNRSIKAGKGLPEPTTSRFTEADLKLLEAHGATKLPEPLRPAVTSKARRDTN